jgi:hypothetical protein
VAAEVTENVRKLRRYLDEETGLSAAAIIEGTVLRPISKGNRALPRPLHPESINTLAQAAVHRADPDATGYSAHSLRAGFVTYAAPPTAPSPTKLDTAPSRESAPTSASRKPGPTTPPPNSGLAMSQPVHLALRDQLAEVNRCFPETAALGRIVVP